MNCAFTFFAIVDQDVTKAVFLMFACFSIYWIVVSFIKNYRKLWLGLLQRDFTVAINDGSFS